MKYNVFINCYSGIYHKLKLSESEVQIIVDAYLKGKLSFTINGDTSQFKNVQTLKIFTYEKEPENWTDFLKACNRENLIGRSFLGGLYYKPGLLSLLGSDVTHDFIENKEYGSEKAEQQKENKGLFINEQRISDLKNITNSNFDTTRLVQLCNEINDNFSRGNNISVSTCTRALIDHIPPLFGYNTFTQVANNYGGNQYRSFKKNMLHLENSLRHISDRNIHQPIRQTESLPNKNQVDFRQDIDVLLEEVARKLREGS